MGAAVVHITEEANWFKGEDRFFDFVVREPPPEPNDPESLGDTLNITGWTIRWGVKMQVDDDALLIDVVGDNSGEPENGLVRVTIPRSVTENMRPGKYAHALARVDNGSFAILAEGNAVLQEAAIS